MTFYIFVAVVLAVWTIFGVTVTLVTYRRIRAMEVENHKRFEEARRRIEAGGRRTDGRIL